MTAGLSPQARYDAALALPGFFADAAQARAVNALQAVYERLLDTPPRLSWRGQRQPWTAVQGLYLWGGVGRGKTWLMDSFYEALPFRYKLRTHFHRFMLDIHQRRRRYPGVQDPLLPIAEDLAQQVRVLCFDEFFVSDIADAMILGRLLEALLSHGVCLVATSNIAPELLYRDGLQRQHFLPAIATLTAAVRVLNVDGGTDYRLRMLEQNPTYWTPADADAEAALRASFAALAPEPGAADVDFVLHGRELRARQAADGIAWFDFAMLCEGPRGVADYLELARTHHTLIVSNVPQLGIDGEDPARRFVHLVDAFYDRNVKLLLSAAVPLSALYAGRKLLFEFERTRSRLLEMQSRDYLARPHLP
jgi:cell division protein ZapE